MSSEEWESEVEKAVNISQKYDEELRPAIILGLLLGGFGGRREKTPESVGPDDARREATSGTPGRGVLDTDSDDVLQPVVEDTGIPLENLQRIVVPKEQNQFDIGGQDVGVRSKSGRQNRWSAIYCYLKEKVHGDYEVESDELIELCRIKRCYDGTNFAKNFRNNPFLSELGGRTDKRYRLTNEGEKTAKELLLRLSGHEEE